MFGPEAKFGDAAGRNRIKVLANLLVAGIGRTERPGVRIGAGDVPILTAGKHPVLEPGRETAGLKTAVRKRSRGGFS